MSQDITSQINSTKQSIRVMKNIIRILLKTKYDGSEVQAATEAITFQDSVIRQQEKVLEELEKLNSNSAEEV